MKLRNILPQLVLGVLFVGGGVVPPAHANSIWTFAGEGDGHTVTAFLELDFDPPVPVDPATGTPFTKVNVVNSEFTISGPNFPGFVGATTSLFSPGSFTFDHGTFEDAMGVVIPPDNLGCLGNNEQGCVWEYVGGGLEVVQFLSATIFNVDFWQVDASTFVGDVGALLNGNTNLGNFTLSGGGTWTPPPRNTDPNPIPEPSTMLLLGLGLVGLVGWQMRKRKG